ncbi:uncharacterized protein LACBIDRAFT_334498 [Laccaria bicolor S238N-H82]|uniref:Predicted protein n=1 Tax=Laccaria bicolor (strain S238N-H82 / ATCC MYA-4686) TaxID=486041 RepID=B0DZD3_LACBS|nr:uncharacterized protein LACBIDRAFT_334498 [Laccaria bicolor S238N-H82]EDR00099.1 predicted protein [Laccaria bicolor S238N-H82]|eukprot:XP_001889305.1 predicted protein [Laccaria bicolor S238N-H82]
MNERSRGRWKHPHTEDEGWNSSSQTKEKGNGRRRGGIQITNIGSMFGEITDIVLGLWRGNEVDRAKLTAQTPRFGSEEINQAKTRVHVTSGYSSRTAISGINEVWQVLPPEDHTKNGFTPKRLPSLRNGPPIRSNFSSAGKSSLLAEIELNKLYLTRITPGTITRAYET